MPGLLGFLAVLLSGCLTNQYNFLNYVNSSGADMYFKVPANWSDFGPSTVFSSGNQKISPGQLAQLAPELPEAYLQGLLQLKHMGAVVLILALRHQLSEEGYYWFNVPKSAGFPFLSLVEHTNFISPEHFGGDHLVYIGDYLNTDHEYFRMSKEELLEKFIPKLTFFNPKFQPDWIRASWLNRTTYAQPIPLINHSRNIPEIQTPVQGLYFASMSQVYPWDRGTNFAVEIARRAARLMLASMG